MLSLLSVLAVAAPGIDVSTRDHAGAEHRVVTLDLTRVRLDLVGQRPGEARTFDALGDDVLAATNAGIFQRPDAPVGVWMDHGVLRFPVETGDGAGNFFLLPNGVFSVDAAGAAVRETGAWRRTQTTRIATQSGPALVVEGELHPALRPDSTSRKTRNGVCASDPWTVHLVLAADPVRLYDFAAFFRDTLGCDDALYLDGTISGLAAPGLPAPPDHTYAGFLVARARGVPTSVREGDLVFQRSRSAQSAWIALATGSPWTHVGVVRMRDGEAWVLEASTTVRLTPLDAWRARGVDAAVGVKRLREGAWDAAARARLDALQERWLGRPYDATFQRGDAALYCSELVDLAYGAGLGVRLAEHRPIGSYATDDPVLRAAMVARWGRVPEDLRVVAPSDLWDSPLLETVR